MTQVKTLTCTIVDRFGRIDGAFAAVYGVCSYARSTAKATNTTDGYKLTNDVEAISYNANYWYNQQTQIDGYMSHQLKIEEDVPFEAVDPDTGKVTQEVKKEFTDIFLVDLNHSEIVSILASNMEPLERDLACAASDLTRRFT